MMASEFDNIYNVSTSNTSIFHRSPTIKESIHSGQFMVSHFEEETEEEVNDDEQIDMKIQDPDDLTVNITEETQINTCRDIQLYVPRKKVVNFAGGTQTTNSTLEIETSLTKLFKCMNLTYSQKLTSPKWNHFKGVRLRWKDKIRLNNVIWRCWHMQFILKRRTPVCQFASPLDTDIHIGPQSVVLEGKYWKRHLDVIKAEYRKWRRSFISNSKGLVPCSDTLSDFDWMEISMPDDRYIFSDDFMNDTLFSSINEPFPFPDRREIAKNASNADLLQPNLGALQPNLDDIDLPYQELFQNVRGLPPVPEEGADDLLKSVESDYQAFSEIIGEDLEQLNSISPSTPLLSDSLVDPKMEQDIFELSNLETSTSNQSGSQHFNSEPQQPQHSPQHFPQQQQISNSIQTQTQQEILKSFPIITPQPTQQSQSTQFSSSFPSNKIKHGRINKSGRVFKRREPHNYERAQPTAHQTNIYQQIVAELTNMQELTQQQQQQQIKFENSIFQINTNESMQPPYQLTNVPQQSNFSLNVPLMNTDTISLNKNLPVPQQVLTIDNATQCSTKMHSDHPDLLSLLNFQQQQQTNPMNINIVALGQTQDQTQNQNIQFVNQLISPMQVQNDSDTVKLNPNQFLLTSDHHISTTTVNPINNLQQQMTVNSPKESFRSNSLPLNASFIKLENREENSFAIPKTCTSTVASGTPSIIRSRNRSNSMQQNQVNAYMQIIDSSKILQSSNSEPMLNSTLAQLLKNNINSPSSPVVSSSTNSNSLQTLKNNSSLQNTNSPKTSSLPPTGLPGYQKTKADLSVTSKSNSLPQNLVLQTNSSLIKSQMNLQSTPSNSVLSLSPESYISDQDFSPVSPPSSYRSVGGLQPSTSSNQRRAGHIHAEQKRRYNIKNGFDLLHQLIPQLQNNSNAKLSKAAMLQKGAEYIRQLRSEREVLREQIIKLRQDRDILNNSLTQLHSLLPANGAPVTRQKTEKVKQLFNEHVRMRTMDNWKYWILGLIVEPLLNSFTSTVSTTSLEELHRTALHWVDQHCSLIELRPAITNKLRELSMTTDLLSDPPSTLQEEVIKAIQNGLQCSTDEKHQQQHQNVHEDQNHMNF